MHQRVRLTRPAPGGTFQGVHSRIALEIACCRDVCFLTVPPFLVSRVRLYIAMSLDGFIADPQGGIGWLEDVPSDAGEDYGYASFFDSIGSLVMGRRTYEQVLTFGGWPYDGKPTYVFTRTLTEAASPDTAIIASDVREGVRRIVRETPGDVWLVGGADLVASFRTCDLIDEYLLFVMPVLLGDGIPLFRASPRTSKLRRTAVRLFPSGATLLHYEPVRNEPPPGGSP